MGKLINIPSHIILENDVADKISKTTCNWQTVLNFFQNVVIVFYSYRIGVWEQVKKSLKIGEDINNIFELRWMTSGLR